MRSRIWSNILNKCWKGAQMRRFTYWDNTTHAVWKGEDMSAFYEPEQNTLRINGKIFTRNKPTEKPTEEPADSVATEQGRGLPHSAHNGKEPRLFAVCLFVSTAARLPLLSEICLGVERPPFLSKFRFCRKSNADMMSKLKLLFCLSFQLAKSY